MPDSLDQQSNEPDTSMPPPGAGPPGATTGGAPQGPQTPAMPPQGGPIARPTAKDAGNQLQMRVLAKAALKLMEQAWSIGRSKTEEGKLIFDTIGKWHKYFGKDDEETQDQELMSSVRKQITSRPGMAQTPAAGGQPPTPPTGPIPKPGGAAPGAMRGY